MVGVPDHRRVAPGDQPQRARHVALAIDAGEDEDGRSHAGAQLPSEPSSARAQRSTRSVLRNCSAARWTAVSRSDAVTVATTTSHLVVERNRERRTGRLIGTGDRKDPAATLHPADRDRFSPGAVPTNLGPISSTSPTRSSSVSS